MTIDNILSFVIIGLVWLFMVRLFNKAGVRAWKFLFGSTGMFVLGILFIAPYITGYINYMLAALVGIFGNITGWHETLFSESAVCVYTAVGNVLLQIDVECSGIIEIMAFLSLMTFFDIYTVEEKFLYGTAGLLFIFFANAIRIVMITSLVYFFGYDIYYVAHTYIGRILFYFLSITLYFYAFTKPQINAMKLGDFKYQKS